MSKIRVLVVDDSVVMRRLIGSVLEDHAEIEVLGVAANGKIALARMQQNRPDLVTLDIEMPEMDGLTTLSEIRRLYPQVPVIMFSTLTRRGAVQTIDALARGAVDYVAKPANVGSVQECIGRLGSELIPKILAVARPARPVTVPSAESVRLVPVSTLVARRPVSVVTVASSTGGPNALQAVLGALPENFPTPLLVVQHMPPVFTGLLAQRLNERSRITVLEAEDGQVFEPGHAYLAPGGKHLEARAMGDRVVACLHEGVPENSCRPSADVLFRSVARIWADRALCVVMTGMGQDGMRGARSIREKGGSVIAQDKESSVVWGMPGSVVEAHLADEVCPLHDMARAILTRLKKESVHASIH